MKKRFLIILALLLVSVMVAQLPDTAKFFTTDQMYLNGWGNQPFCDDASQVAVSGGLLTITATKGATTCGGNSGNAKAGMVVTSPFYFTYGHVVVVGRSGKYIHTGLAWFDGGAPGTAGWPPTWIGNLQNAVWCGSLCNTTDFYEVDMTEVKPGTTGVSQVWNNVILWHNGSMSTNDSGSYAAGFDASAALHTYEWIWTASGHTFKADGTITHTSSQVIPSNVAMFLITDLEPDSMGNFTGSVTTDSSAIQTIRICSSTTSACAHGDPTMEFEYIPGGAGVNTISAGTARQGSAIQGTAAQ